MAGLVGQTQVQDNDNRPLCGGAAKIFGLQSHDEATPLP
jgi:hypothetical protein